MPGLLCRARCYNGYGDCHSGTRKHEEISPAELVHGGDTAKRCDGHDWGLDSVEEELSRDAGDADCLDYPPRQSVQRI